MRRRSSRVTRQDSESEAEVVHEAAAGNAMTPRDHLPQTVGETTVSTIMTATATLMQRIIAGLRGGGDTVPGALAVIRRTGSRRHSSFEARRGGDSFFYLFMSFCRTLSVLGVLPVCFNDQRLMIMMTGLFTKHYELRGIEKLHQGNALAGRPILRFWERSRKSFLYHGISAVELFSLK